MWDNIKNGVENSIFIDCLSVLLAQRHDFINVCLSHVFMILNLLKYRTT